MKFNSKYIHFFHKDTSSWENLKAQIMLFHCRHLWTRAWGGFGSLGALGTHTVRLYSSLKCQAANSCYKVIYYRSKLVSKAKTKQSNGIAHGIKASGKSNGKMQVAKCIWHRAPALPSACSFIETSQQAKMQTRTTTS